MSKAVPDFCYPPPPKNDKISSAFSYNFKSALTGTAAQTAAESAPVQDTPAPAGKESTPIAYTPDMTVGDISEVMTLEQAKAVVVQGGTCKGWTLEQVAADRPSSLKWLRYTAPFADNVLKTAADILLNSLELKKAG